MRGQQSLRRMGIDARSALYAPLSTACAVAASAVLLSLPLIFAAPAALPLAFLFYLGTGLWLVVQAGPVTLPSSLVVRSVLYATVRQRGWGASKAALQAAAGAAVAVAAGFAARAARHDAGVGLFIVILPGVVLGAVMATHLLDWGRKA